MQANLALHRGMLRFEKKFSRAAIMFRAESEAPTSLLIGINPMKCSETMLLTQNVAYTENCSMEVMSVVSSL